MSITNFIFLQIIAHLLADYIFQNEIESKEKNQNGFKSIYLKKHIFIVFITSWILSFSLNFIIGSAIIAFLHFIIDGLKPEFPKKYSFFIDQFLHLVVIFGVAIWSFKYFNNHLDFYVDFGKKPILAVILCFLFCTKPVNIIIREIMKTFEIEIKLSDDLPNAGKLIGITERFLILIFIFMQQFEAIGFLLAAKSILRYKNDEEKCSIKTEYVLIGTLLSFGLTLAITQFVRYLDYLVFSFQ
jgi:hypothetical protein